MRKYLIQITSKNEKFDHIQQVAKLNYRPGKNLGFLSPIEFLLLNFPNHKVAFVI